MRKIFTTLTFVFVLALSTAGQSREIHVFAHRGCWSKSASGEFIIPENSVAAVAEAGYQVQASIFPLEQEKRAIGNGITYLLTDRILPSRKWKKIRTRPVPAETK